MLLKIDLVLLLLFILTSISLSSPSHINFNALDADINLKLTCAMVPYPFGTAGIALPGFEIDCLNENSPWSSIPLLSISNHSYTIQEISLLQGYIKIDAEPIYERCFGANSEGHGWFNLERSQMAISYESNNLVQLNWAIGNKSCEASRNDIGSLACKNNSYCRDTPMLSGYLCNCSQGYEGNPYAKDGCTDIDECLESDPCVGHCINLPGNYICSCPKGRTGDGKKGGSGCHKRVFPLDVALGVTITLGFSLAMVILLSYFAIVKRIKLFEKRKQEKLKQKFFVQNRGLLLQQLIASHENATQNMRILRLHELEKATNRFDNALIIGRGGHGEVYKGILLDQRVVAIKRSKIVDPAEIYQFINEVVILSQVNHRNIVKLYGCCLETEVPLLAYEFISNGTLFSHLHVEGHCSLTWKHRL